MVKECEVFDCKSRNAKYRCKLGKYEINAVVGMWSICMGCDMCEMGENEIYQVHALEEKWEK